MIRERADVAAYARVEMGGCGMWSVVSSPVEDEGRHRLRTCTLFAGFGTP